MRIEVGKNYRDGWGCDHHISGTTDSKDPNHCCANENGECAFWSRGGDHFAADGRMIGRPHGYFTLIKEVE